MSIVDYLKTPSKEVGRKTLEQIKQLLTHARPGFMAGTWLHVGGNSEGDPKEWAKVLKVREQSGEGLSIVQKRAWRDALGDES